MARTPADSEKWVSQLDLSRRMFAVDAHLFFAPQEKSSNLRNLKAPKPSQSSPTPERSQSEFTIREGSPSIQRSFTSCDSRIGSKIDPFNQALSDDEDLSSHSPRREVHFQSNSQPATPNATPPVPLFVEELVALSEEEEKPSKDKKKDKKRKKEEKKEKTSKEKLSKEEKKDKRKKKDNKEKLKEVREVRGGKIRIGTARRTLVASADEGGVLSGDVSNSSNEGSPRDVDTDKEPDTTRTPLSSPRPMLPASGSPSCDLDGGSPSVSPRLSRDSSLSPAPPRVASKFGIGLGVGLGGANLSELQPKLQPITLLPQSTKTSPLPLHSPSLSPSPPTNPITVTPSVLVPVPAPVHSPTLAPASGTGAELRNRGLTSFPPSKLSPPTSKRSLPSPPPPTSSSPPKGGSMIVLQNNKNDQNKPSQPQPQPQPQSAPSSPPSIKGSQPLPQRHLLEHTKTTSSFVLLDIVNVLPPEDDDKREKAPIFQFESDEEDTLTSREEYKDDPEDGKLILSEISLENFPELSFVFPLTPASPPSPEALLLAWVSYHLDRSPSVKLTATSFPSSFTDGQVLTVLLNQLEPEICDLSPLKQTLNARLATLQTFLSDLNVKTSTDLSTVLKDKEQVVKLIARLFIKLLALGELTELASKRLCSCKYLNRTLKNHPSLKQLVPFDEITLLSQCRTGVVLSQLLNVVFGDIIDENFLHKSESLTPDQLLQNINLCVNACTAVGIGLKVKSPQIIEKKPDSLLLFVWGVVEGCVLSEFSPEKHPELTKFGPNLSKRKLLLKWFNYHLKKSTNRTINNLTVDLEDSKNLFSLLQQISPAHTKNIQVKGEDWEKRAHTVLEICKSMGLEPLIQPRDIVQSENEDLLLVFLSDLFHFANDLQQDFSTDIKDEPDVTRDKKNENEDTELLVWIQQLKINREVRRFDEDLKDGTILLQIVSKALPETSKFLEPKKLNFAPGTSVFKRLELCQHALDVIQKISGTVKLPPLNSKDIVDGRYAQTKALLQHIRRLGEGAQSNQKKKRIPSTTPTTANNMFRSARIRTITDDDVLTWVNKIGAKKVTKLSDCDFRLAFEVLNHVSPRDKCDVTQLNSLHTNGGLTNAKQLLSRAWRNGISIPLRPQDFSESMEAAFHTFMKTLFIHCHF
eukprot:TRINITY_DN2145_c0_g1_i1.p1 TRINITY_DN2145_c0_g1~~TRINITY_DN2145_c0_g1_i1.p1  ORF type:complete len:1145 (-),score=282.98 TRINITY_DN2145_c0_g1_i1:46-3480(-)